MKKYILKRILQSVIVMFIMSIFAFALINAAPGEPAAAIYGGQLDRLTVTEKARINQNLGLDQPVLKRYCCWVGQMSKGEMGYSYRNGRSVNELIAARMPNTLRLFAVSYSLTLLFAIVIGLWSGSKPDSALDRGVTVASITTNGIPSILVAILLIWVFSVKLGILPSSGCQSIFASDSTGRGRYMVLPVITIMLSHVGAFSRFIQEGMKDELKSYYVTVQRANRVSKRKIMIGAMKNALVPFVNYAGTHIPSFFSGFVVVEVVFSYPGLGNLVYSAIPVKDYPLLMGGILVTGMVVVISMLIIDLVDLALNPKLRKAVI